MRYSICIGLLAAALINGCAQASTRLPPPLPQPVQRINLYGFSFQPSNEPGWVELGKTPFALALSRREGNPDETDAIEVGVLKSAAFSSASEFAKEWKASEDQNTNPIRFTIVSHDVTVVQYKGASCARSHFVVQDHAPHTMSHKHETMILESLTLACPYPANPRIIAYVTYSQRYYPAEGDATFAAAADGILDSIEFTPIPKAAVAEHGLEWKHVPYRTVTGQTLTLDILGGAGGDWSRDIHCAKNDSCTLFGYTTGSFPASMDELLTHLGPKKNVQWAETISGGYSDRFWHAISTRDGGFFAVGTSESRFPSKLKIYSPHHPNRPLFVRLGSAGRVIWAGSIELDSTISTAEIGVATQTADGGYLLAGSYTEAYPESGAQPLPGVWSGAAPGKERGRQYTYPLLLKLGPNGKPKWLRRYAFGNNGGAALAVTEMPSGHVLLIGSVYVDKTNKLFVMETDGQGVPLQAEQYTLPQRLGVNAVLRLKDGDYLVLGYANTHSAHDGFTALLTPDLKLAGGMIYHNLKGLRPMDMVQAPDGRICVVGRTENPQTNKAEGVAWVINEHGDDLSELWLSGQGNTELESVSVLSDGAFRLIGDTEAFGAFNHNQIYDQLLTDWNPLLSSKGNPKQLSLTTFKPNVDDVKVTSDTAKLGLIESITPGSFELTPLTINAAGNH